MKSKVLLKIAILLWASLAYTEEFYHTVQKYEPENRVLTLEDGSEWKIGWWYGSKPKSWNVGDQLKVFYTYLQDGQKLLYNDFSFFNERTQETVWGVWQKLPDEDQIDSIARLPNGPRDPDAWKKAVLKSGWILTNPQQFYGWNVRDRVFLSTIRMRNMRFGT